MRVHCFIIASLIWKHNYPTYIGERLSITMKKLKKYSKNVRHLITAFKFDRYWGIGARYGAEYVVSEFLKEGVACIGHAKSEVPEIFAQFKTVKKGDRIFMKAYGPSSTQICVMGAGTVIGNNIYKVSDELGYGMDVDWVWGHADSEEIYLIDSLGKDKHRNVRLGTLYEEFNPKVKRALAILMAEKLAA